MMGRPILLSVENISKKFGGLQAVDHVSFQIHPGDILGLIGPNGAGKTTCFNMISGIYKPSSGEIYLDGQRIDGLPPHSIARLGIGRTFQIVKPFSNLSVLENILVALGVQHYASLLDITHKWRSPSVVDEGMDILKRVGLESYAFKQSATLPLGDLRRLEIGRALALNPKLLLLDESFSGLRQEQIVKMEEFVLSLVSQGVSILLIEHNMKVAMKLCNRIVVLDHGRWLTEGSPSDVTLNPDVIEAYLGKGELDHAAAH